METSSRYAQLLAVFLVWIGIFALLRLARSAAGTWWWAAIVAGSIFVLRYSLVLIQFPSAYLTGPIFDTSQFASPVGSGIASSVADILITALFLLAAVVELVRSAVRNNPEGDGSSGWSIGRLNSAQSWAVIIALLLFFFIALRAYCAILKGCVVDSGLRYNDPMFVIPPPDLGAMYAALFLLSLSFIVIATSVVIVVKRAVHNLSNGRLSTLLSGIITLVLFIAAAFVLPYFVTNPLTSDWERVFFAAIAFACAFVAERWYAQLSVPSADGMRQVRSRLGTAAVIVCAAAAMVLMEQVDGFVHAADRAEVETVARDLVLPSQERFTSLVSRTLDDLSALQSDSVSFAEDSDAHQTLAFTGWASSVLSREGYNCWVEYFDRSGNVVSDFHLGAIRHSSDEVTNEIISPGRQVQAEDRFINGKPVRIYRGSASVRTNDRAVVGTVRVEIAADREALLGSETPEVLRNYGPGKDKKFFRPLVLTEYYQGKLLYSTSEIMPKDHTPPPELRSQGSSGGMWVQETIDETGYETFYIPRVDDKGRVVESSWVAIGMQTLDVRWHLFIFLRLIFFLVLLGVVTGLLYLLWRYAAGRRVRFGFRSKLLTAFFLVALIPIVLLAYYNRNFAIEHEESITVKNLSDQTDAIVSTLQKRSGLATPFDLTKLNDDDCGDVAEDLGSDFNVYAPAFLQATSKPEMFLADLLDRRINEDAYTNIVLRKKGFFANQESIGDFLYMVGYRPLVSNAGTVIGIVAEPTLYRQEEIDNELMERNAFLFGAYALAVAIAVAAGLLFARQISSPVLELREATESVARGNLGATLEANRADEFGDLQRAFNKMTGDLRKSREDAIRAERELAWKEMAKQVAHEIKNPLTPIKLSIQHLRQAYADGAGGFGDLLKQTTSTVLEQIEALSRIASEFSNFARLPKRMLAPCDVHEILTEAQKLFEQESRVYFDLRLHAAKSEVVADKDELRRAFINVIKNGIQAIEGAGTITLVTESSARLISIGILDTGKGVPPEIRDRLFEPNFSTKSEGMGLGLAIVKKTIDDLGGRISLESEVGKGTRVKIEIPLA
jgi:signal transduction histidine kinase